MTTVIEPQSEQQAAELRHSPEVSIVIPAYNEEALSPKTWPH